MNRVERFRQMLAAGTTGLEGALDDEGYAYLTHYAKQPLDVVDPSKQLTGLIRPLSREAQRIQYDQAPRVKWARATEGVKARVKGIEATAQRRADACNECEHRSRRARCPARE